MFPTRTQCLHLAGRSLSIASLLLVIPSSVARAQDPPNILFIFLDDLGIEHLEFYEIQSELPPEDREYADTPYLFQTFAPNALRFNQAWSNPVCSPTRSTIHTGLYGFRTGVGQIINTDETWGIDTDDDGLLPRVLAGAGYATGDFGKWHMGTSDGGPSEAGDQGGDGAPIVGGYDVFRGVLADKHPTFMTDPVYCEYTWTECENQEGEPVCMSTAFDAGEDDYCSDPDDEWDHEFYMTRRIFTAAFEWIEGVEIDDPNQPWFAYVALFSPHLPFHCPPDDMLSPNATECDDSGAQPSDLLMYQSMINSVDVQIDQLLGSLGIDPTQDQWNDTYVIIASDNGSPREVVHAPVRTGRSKGTVFQGGVRVPLMIGGPGVVPGEIDDIVSLSDLYDTILDLANLDSPRDSDADGGANDDDSQSLKPYVDGTATGPIRDWAYTEQFSPNFDPGSGNGPTQAQQTIRNHAYKYVVFRSTDANSFYDLVSDPWEDDDILELGSSQVMPADDDNWDELTVELDELAGDILDLCDPARRAGAPCTSGEDCCSSVCDLDGVCINGTQQ